MKVFEHLRGALLASLWSASYGLSEDWFDDALKQGFPHVQSVMSIVLKKPDPCEVAVVSMESHHNGGKNDLFEEMFEKVFPTRACRGQIMFSRADEEECMAIQSSPEIEEMILKGIESPALVCGWRKFWINAKANDGVSLFNSCELCERTVAMIENTFEKQEIALEIVQEALKVLCQYLPEGSQCKVLVERFDDIVNWLKQGLSPHHICQKVSMCEKLALPHHPSSQAIALRGAHNEELCTICRDNANAMNSLVELPHGLELYKKGMDSVCVSAAETKTCQFMSTHFHKIAKHLQRGDDVSSTCRAVRACASTEIAVIQNPTFLGCVYCEFVGEVTTSALHQGGNATLPLVKMDVEAMCKNMPASAQCSVMDAKFYELADLMAKGETPQVGCEAIEMCSHVTAKQTSDTQIANILSVLDKLVTSLDVSYDANHYVGCSTCEHTVYAIERVEKQHKSSLPMLKKAIGNLCHFLPPCAECRKIYSHFDDLVALVEKGEHARQACTELGFCKPESSLATPYLLQLESQVKQLIDGKIGSKNDAIGCMFCEYTGEMITQVAKYSKDVVPLLKIGLETLCTRLPKEAKCTDVVESFDAIAKLIEAGKTSHEACEHVKLCEASALSLAAPSSKSKALTPSTEIITKLLEKIEPTLEAEKSDSITCTMCKATAESIAAILKYNKELIPVFKMGMEVLCDRLQTPQCVNVMPEFDHLVDLVESGKDFIAACEAAKLCEATSTALIATHPTSTALTSNSKSSKAMIVSSKIVMKALKAMKPTIKAVKSDEVTCSMCEATAESIDMVSKYNKQLIPVLKMGLEILCDRFQTPQCIHVMPEFDHLVELIDSGKNFLEACESAKLCDSLVLPFYQTNQVAVQKVNEMEAQIRNWMKDEPTESNDAITCLFCEYTGLVIDQVAHYDKDIVPFLKTGIETLCAQLPVKEECEEVVAKFDSLAELIESGSASTEACTKVHLCQVREQPALPSSLNGYVSSQVAILEAKMNSLVHSSENDIFSCLLCEDTAQLIKTVSKYDKDAVPLLKSGIQALCTQLPQLQAQCNSIVNQFDTLASLIEGGEDPSVACGKVHLCEAALNTATSTLESHVADLLAHPDQISSEEGCLFCQYASESISTVMKFDKGQLPMVREAIGAMCSVLPPSVHCDDVNEHFEELAKSLEQGASALDACHRIALCESRAMNSVPSSLAEDAAMKFQVVIDEVVANQ